MPIYEYRCEPCDQTFETLIRSSSDVARCPKCGNVEVAKQFSVPAAAQTGGGNSLPVCNAPSGMNMGMGCGAGGCGGGMCGMG